MAPLGTSTLAGGAAGTHTGSHAHGATRGGGGGISAGEELWVIGCRGLQFSLWAIVRMRLIEEVLHLKMESIT